MCSALDKDDSFSACLQTGWTIFPNDGHLATFTTAGAHQCWLYCKHIFRCFALSFDITNGTCSLRTRDYLTLQQKRVRPHYFTLNKFCMEKDQRISPGLSISEAVSLSQSGSGVLIRQDGAGLACLTGRKTPSETEIYRLSWKSCTEAGRWDLKNVEIQNDALEYYQITSAEEPDFCLDIIYDEIDGGIGVRAVLAKCRDITLANQEDPQIMFVTIASSIIGYERQAINSVAGLSYTLFTGTGYDISDAESLYGVTFEDPDQYQSGAQSCPLHQFSVPDGRVKNKDNVPIILPGDKVEIQCDKGYGVRGLNWTTVQTVTCSQDAKPRLCKRFSPTEACQGGDMGKGKLYFLFMVVAIVSTVSAGVLLVMLLKVEKRGNNGVEEGDTVQKENTAVNMESKIST